MESEMGLGAGWNCLFSISMSTISEGISKITLNMYVSSG